MDRDGNRLMRGALTCAFGGAVGTFLSLQFGIYFWWLGTLAGGSLVYLAYDIKEVAAASKRAYHEVMGWQPDVVWWKACIVFTLSLWGTFLTCGIGISIFAHFLAWTQMGYIPTFAQWLKLTLPFLGLASVAAFVAAFFVAVTSGVKDLNEASLRMKYLRNPLKVYLWYVPLGLLIALATGLTMIGFFLFGTTSSIPVMARMSYKWLGRTLRLIHSEYRLMIGLDAALGAAGGYMFDSIFAGFCLAGALFVVNVELVAKRYMRLRPQW